MEAKAQAGEVDGQTEADPVPPVEQARPGLSRHLPAIDELIEDGKVLALNMPVGANPALARAIGVMLKNAWLQALVETASQDEGIAGKLLPPGGFHL